MVGTDSDPFEDFEFQPLTEGLGFHKKADEPKRFPLDSKVEIAKVPAAKIQSTVQSKIQSDLPKESGFESKRSATQSISELMASLPPSLDFVDAKPERPQIFQPIAREEYKPAPAAAVTTPTGVLPTPGSRAAAFSTVAAPAPLNSMYRDRMSESFAKSFPRTEKAKAASDGLTPVPVSFASGVVDAMMVTGIATVLLVCILQITKINLIGMLSNAQTDGPTQANLVLLLLAVYQMYMLISRAFFGASLGEWAFELQLGRNEQQVTGLYPVQVMIRSLLTMFTGFILLPLLSVVFNRDLSKYVTGLQLYRRT